jgi:hypothetical protein
VTLAEQLHSHGYKPRNRVSTRSGTLHQRRATYKRVIAGVAVAVAVLLILTTPVPALAADGTVLAAPNNLGDILSNIRTWLMTILAGIATVFLTIGGVRYLMAGGDPSEVERAKSAFKSAGIGYALAIAAPVILTILDQIVGTP